MTFSGSKPAAIRSTSESSAGTSNSRSSGRTTSNNHGHTDSEGSTTSESEVDIPIFFPVPFEELSSIQYFSLEEQLTELTAALKEQFPRHCFIKIHGQKTQPMLVPFVGDIRSFRESSENLDWYRQSQMQRQNALPIAEVDRLLEMQETALIHTTSQAPSPACEQERAPIVITKKRAHETPIWNRGARS